jgi:hypothetical protein
MQAASGPLSLGAQLRDGVELASRIALLSVRPELVEGRKGGALSVFDKLRPNGLVS